MNTDNKQSQLISVLQVLYSRIAQGKFFSTASLLALLTFAHDQARALSKTGEREITAFDLLADTGWVDAALQITPAISSQLEVPQSIESILSDGSSSALSLNASTSLTLEFLQQLQLVFESQSPLNLSADIQLAQAEASASLEPISAGQDNAASAAKDAGPTISPDTLPATSAGPLIGLAITPITAAAAGVGALALTNTTASSTSTTSSTSVPTNLIGKVVDGYISGATIKVIRISDKVVLNEKTPITTDDNGQYVDSSAKLSQGSR